MSEDLQIEMQQKLKAHSNFILKSFVIALWISSILMFIIIIMGMIKICQGIYFEILMINNNPELHDKGVIRILDGIELIFLSPIIYLLILSTTKYSSAVKPEVNPNLENKKSYLKHSIAEIINVKIFTTALFISWLILHSIKLIIENNMTFESSIYIILLLMTIFIYYNMLEKNAEKINSDH